MSLLINSIWFTILALICLSLGAQSEFEFGAKVSSSEDTLEEDLQGVGSSNRRWGSFDFDEPFQGQTSEQV